MTDFSNLKIGRLQAATFSADDALLAPFANDNDVSTEYTTALTTGCFIQFQVRPQHVGRIDNVRFYVINIAKAERVRYNGTTIQGSADGTTWVNLT